MKTSNLLGVLALGGIGYYLLKNKNKPVVSDFAQQISLDATPVSATSVSDTLNSTTPLSTATTSAIPVSTPSPKIETALAPLGIQNAVQSKSLVVDKVSDEIYQSDTNCQVPNEGWESIDVDGFIGNNSDIRNLVMNLDLKERAYHFRDLCGNIVQKQTSPLPKQTHHFGKILPDGFMKRLIGLKDMKLAPKYYVKNQRVIVLPYKMVNEYREKYIVPLEKYLKNLPQIDPSRLNSLVGKYNYITHKIIEPYGVNENGEELGNYPLNGVWKYPPFGINGTGLGMAELKSIMETEKNNDIKTLVNNPRIRNSNDYYIDQFGNMIHIPYLNYKGEKISSSVFFTNNVIAEYRVNHGIPF